MHSPDLVFLLAAALGGALLLGLVAQRLRLPPIVGYLAAGVIVGPHTPGFVANPGLASELAELGVVLLLFGVGLEFHVEQLLAVKVGRSRPLTRDTKFVDPQAHAHGLGAAPAALPLPIAPTALPFGLGEVRAPNRIAIATASTHAGELAADDDLVALGAAAAAGAGAVITPPIAIAATPLAGPRINTDEQAVAWKRIVEFVHGKDAVVIARIATAGAVPGALEAAVQRAAFAGFDMIALDPGPDAPGVSDGVSLEHLPALVQAARGVWPKPRAIAAWIHDRPHARAAQAGHAAQLVRAGASLLIVASRGDAWMAGARLPAAPLADQLRNELGVATAVVADATASLPDLDAAIAAGRADLVVVQQMPGGFTKR